MANHNEEMLKLTTDEAKTILNNRLKMAKAASGENAGTYYGRKPAHPAPVYWRQAAEACEILALVIKREHLGKKSAS